MDDLALDYAIVRFQEAGLTGAPLFLAGDTRLSGTSAEAGVSFVLPSTLWGKEISFAIDVVDSGGNTRGIALAALIAEDGSIRFESAPGAGFNDPPSVDTSAGNPVVNHGGCALFPARKGGAGGVLTVAIGLVLAALRRHRRA